MGVDGIRLVWIGSLQGPLWTVPPFQPAQNHHGVSKKLYLTHRNKTRRPSVGMDWVR
jgi:hypothetical protein